MRRRSSELDQFTGPARGRSGGRSGGFRSPGSIIPEWVWALLDGLLAFIIGGALAATVFGYWIGKGASLLAGLVTNVIGWFGGSVSSAVLLSVVVAAMLLVLVLDLLDLESTKAAMVCLILMPSIAVRATGPVAEVAMRLLSSAQEVGMATLGALLGG